MIHIASFNLRTHTPGAMDLIIYKKDFLLYVIKHLVSMLDAQE